VPTKTKKKVSKKVSAGPIERMQDSGVLSVKVPPEKRTHSEFFRWVEDFQVSSRHRREGQYMPVDRNKPMMLSTYILDEIFGEKGAELPKEIKITVEW
jgi:hypothetical protein